jgi:hypothetical protein
MAGKLAGKALPKGKDRDGRDQQPDDGQIGQWPKAELERMNLEFSSAMQREQQGKPRR